MTIDAEIYALHAAVGRAIASWSAIETDLTQIFCCCVAPSMTSDTMFQGGSGSAIAIFHSVENLNAKLSLIDGGMAALDGLGPEATGIQNCWKKARKKTSDLSRRRNKLAHWTVLTYRDCPEGQRARLVPSLFHPAFREQTFRRYPGFDERVVNAWAEAFTNHAEFRLRPIYQLMGRHLGLQKTFAHNIACQIGNAEHRYPELASTLREALTAGRTA